MNSSKYFTFLFFSLLPIISQAQVVQVNKLAEISELGDAYRIEANGDFSYVEGNSIFYSSDEGNNWQELETPFELRYSTGTDFVTSYKGIESGNYILHTRHKMYYYEGGEWNLLSIEGDTLFDEGPYVIDDKVVLIKSEAIYLYDNLTHTVSFLQQLEPYCCHRIELFQNHFLLRGQSNRYSIWTNDFQELAEIDFVGYGIDAYITREGYIIKQTRTWNNSNFDGKYGSTTEISKDDGVSFTTIHQSDTEEYRIIGDINGRLYYRGVISQPEAWSYGHLQARIGSIDYNTGELIEVGDGAARFRNNLPVVVGNDLYHHIEGAIIKYPNGDFDDRQVIFTSKQNEVPITKLRETANGVLYAKTSTFLYVSYDSGENWDNLLDFKSVIDFDLSEDDQLYVISNDQILKSTDEGQTFSELSKLYSEGVIDFPSQIISVENNKILLLGIGHYFPEIEWVECFDCYIAYPSLIFESINDGANWSPAYVFHPGYGPDFPVTNVYGYESGLAIQSSNYMITSDQISFTANNEISIFEKSNLSNKNLILERGDWPDIIEYSFTKKGDLIKNDLGQVSYSSDCGSSFTNLDQTNYGRIYPGAKVESLFGVSKEDDNFGSLSYQLNYNSQFENLIVQIKNTGEIVQDSFDRVYSVRDAEFLFSGKDTYEILPRTVSTDVTTQLLEIKIFPNPSLGLVDIAISDYNGENLKAKLVDLQGKVLQTLEVNQNQFQIDLTDYTDGLYLIRIQGEQKSYVRKIVLAKK